LGQIHASYARDRTYHVHVKWRGEGRVKLLPNEFVIRIILNSIVGHFFAFNGDKLTRDPIL